LMLSLCHLTYKLALEPVDLGCILVGPNM